MVSYYDGGRGWPLKLSMGQGKVKREKVALTKSHAGKFKSEEKFSYHLTQSSLGTCVPESGLCDCKLNEDHKETGWRWNLHQRL